MNERRGFALAELLVALVIAGIIGVALTRLVISQSRFIAMQDGMMRARSGARASLNVLAEELRGITSGGILAATADSVTFRMPYVFGVACGQTGGTTIISALPADSARFGTATSRGYAWRDSLGVWQFVEPATVTAPSPSLASTCTAGIGGGPPVQVLGANGWTASGIAVSPNVLATAVGAPMYVYQEVTYSFAPSVELPGRRALWRRITGGGAMEELVAPFDSTARFQYLYGHALTPVSSPAILDSVVAVRAELVAASEHAPPGRARPVVLTLTADLFFRSHGP